MARMVRGSRANAEVRNTARELTAFLLSKAWREEIRTCFEFVRDQIRYVMDPVAVELVQAPEVTLAVRAGDCDDKAVLLAALLMAIGHPCRFVAVAFDNPSVFEHVYVQAAVGDPAAGEWVSLDPTEPYEMGWRPPNSTNAMVETI